MSNQARRLPAAGDSLTTMPTQRPRALKVTQPVALSAVEIHKSYRKGRLEVPVLRGTTFSVFEGEFAAIVGQSGSGKSTLLHLLGTLDQPDRGEIWLGQQSVQQMTASARDRARNQDIGLIFQFYHLLPELSMLENVMVPRMIHHGVLAYWRNRRKFVDRAKMLLDKVGLSHRLTHRPNQLSGGEMQRAAIARALISEPSILLADEPTGNLDSENGHEVMRVLSQLRQQENITIIMVTHDEQIAAAADRTIRLVEGKVEA